eukprot:gene20121-29487_t
MPPKVTKVLEEVGFRWVRLQKLEYQDADGKTRLWESAVRTTRRGDVDGVGILAMVHKAGRPSKIVLVTQFRPPCDGNVIELAAGLIDAGETATEAAVRELKEETGKSKLVVLDVDGDAAINATPTLTATPEEGEHIVVQLAPLEGLQGWLDARLAAEPGLCVDARLYSFAAGFGAGRIGSALAGAFLAITLAKAKL